MSKKHSGSKEGLVCSFCRKNQAAVGKLISTSDYPRTYICDECVAVCNTILEHEKTDERQTQPMQNPNQCEHMWQGDFVWVAVSFENPAKQRSSQPVEYVPLERCIHCGILRLAVPQASTGPRDVA